MKPAFAIESYSVFQSGHAPSLTASRDGPARGAAVETTCRGQTRPADLDRDLVRGSKLPLGLSGMVLVETSRIFDQTTREMTSGTHH